MQMKKNYLLLFLMALLFGTANMRGQSLPWSQLEDEKNGFTVKIGKGYLKITATEATCESDFSKLPKSKLTVSKQTNSPMIVIAIAGGSSLSYNKKGLSLGGANTKFLYEQEEGKYYIRTLNFGKKYLTNKGGKLSLETAASEDAVVEITRKAVGGGKNLDVVGQQYHYALALFQVQRHGLTNTESPFMGDGLGQYSKNFTDNGENWNTSVNNQFSTGNSPAYSEDLVSAREQVLQGLVITPLTQGKYVYITTKSQFEDAVRQNSDRTHSNTPINEIPGVGQSQPAKYLKATAHGYELTSTKDEAAVFYFDGNHLTGLDNGFGLGESRYSLTADAQKAVVAKGLLEKTLDAGSYSVKVGDKFVKLDRDNGLSLSTNESDSHLFLEEAEKFTLHTDALGYVSFYAPTAVQVPNNVKVYTGKLNAGNTQLTFTEVNSKQIPENTAVLLQMGTSKTQFEVKKIATASAIPNNSLKGYTVSSADHKNNAYGLMSENGKLVFKPLSDGVRAFRAVIYQDNGAGTQEFILTSFAPTGIEGVTAKEKQEDVFDLAGRRVEFPVKGQVYVKGGKKFIQK